MSTENMEVFPFFIEYLISTGEVSLFEEVKADPGGNLMEFIEEDAQEEEHGEGGAMSYNNEWNLTTPLFALGEKECRRVEYRIEHVLMHTEIGELVTIKSREKLLAEIMKALLLSWEPKEERLRAYLTDCDEWIEEKDLDEGSIRYLQARLKRVVTELRSRLDGGGGEVSDYDEGKDKLYAAMRNNDMLYEVKELADDLRYATSAYSDDHYRGYRQAEDDIKRKLLAILEME